MRKLVHVSNLYVTRPAIDLASLLLSLLSPRIGKYAAVQFGNSGSEANEANAGPNMILPLKCYNGP